jgi:oligopeptide/dipeptide ABC transporter ATP-binding protein
VSRDAVVELDDVSRTYGATRAVDGVSLALSRTRSVGLVGESGSGKSTIARLVLALERPSAGQLRFDARPYGSSERQLRALRRTVAMVFQDPYDSLDPRFRIDEVVAEPLRAHGRWRAGGSARVDELLEAVGLSGLPQDGYPGSLSGGQRQRLGIARALALEPEILVLDEPTSALDVSVQAQILNLLLEIQVARGLGYLFISHDLEVVRRMSDEIVVLYAGSVVEHGSAAAVTSRPRHPYTQALLSAIPGSAPTARRLDRRVRLVETESGDGEPAGCAFAPRCPRAEQRCRVERPALEGEPHPVACHFPEAS